LHDEKRNAMEEMTKDFELAALEHQYIWVDEDNNINLEHLFCQQWGVFYGQ
jgi:hypothetical protein